MLDILRGRMDENQYRFYSFEVILDITINSYIQIMGQNQQKKEQEDQINDHERLGHLKLQAVPGVLQNEQ